MEIAPLTTGMKERQTSPGKMSLNSVSSNADTASRCLTSALTQIRGEKQRDRDTSGGALHQARCDSPWELRLEDCHEFKTKFWENSQLLPKLPHPRTDVLISPFSGHSLQAWKSDGQLKLAAQK